jgi:transposase
MLNGICWVLRSGAAWRDLPERYGPWQTVYKRFVKWSKAGVFEKIFKDLADDADMQDITHLYFLIYKKKKAPEPE